MATLRRVPAEITVFAGDFASQPLAFAHLWDVAPDLDLDHVEVIGRARAETRLAAYFEPDAAAHVLAAAAPRDTVILILPAAYPGSDCPVGGTPRLSCIGPVRGRVPHLSAAGPAS